MVLNNDIKPTIRPIKAALVSQNVKFVDDKARQKKAGEILERLKKEGVIIDNPDQGSGGQIVAKYVRNPDYKEQGAGPVNSSAQDSAKYIQLAKPVNCICPSCGAVEVVAETTPKGRVRSGCGKIYKAADNLENPKAGWSVKPVAGAGIGISEEGVNPIAGLGAIISK